MERDGNYLHIHIINRTNPISTKFLFLEDVDNTLKMIEGALKNNDVDQKLEECQRRIDLLEAEIRKIHDKQADIFDFLIKKKSFEEKAPRKEENAGFD